jgi:membrane fusion protein (multidrug efflux system)
LDRVRVLLGFSRITAPFAGVITARCVDPGAFIPAATSGSAAANAAIVTLMDFNTVRAQVALPEMEVSYLAVDEPVRITTDALPGRRFDGKVTRFSYAVDPVSKTMLTEIELANPKLELRPGMLINARIGLETKRDALVIPVGALVTEKSATSVFKLAGGKAKKTPVKVGFNDGIKVEIREGATADEPLIVVGAKVLMDGQAVKTVEAP